MKVEMETPKDKIKMIMERLGMSGTIAAKAMSMPDSTFRKKVMPSLPHITFTEKNHSDLVDFLISEYPILIDKPQFDVVPKPVKDVNLESDKLVDVDKAFIDINYTFTALINEDKSNRWKRVELRKILNQLHKTQFNNGVDAGFRKIIKILGSPGINEI